MTTIELRDYQIVAIEKTSSAIASGVKRPLIIAPTASGKSLIIAGIIKKTLEKKSDRRVLSLCFQNEILEQNERALKNIIPEVDCGIFCASSYRKESDRQVIFASRDSLGPRPEACGEFDLVLVDEAHLISPRTESRYQKIFQALNPKWVVGLTGTPWRLDGGNIWGEKAYFEKISYNISLDLLIERGYLSPYIFVDEEPIIKTDNVRVKSTGDFDEVELEKISSTEEVVERCLSRWALEAFDRKVSLFFCCSLAHAELVFNKLKEKYPNVAYLDGKTNKTERAELIEEAKKGKYKAIVNVGVLTTGVDIPIIDCIVMLRATKSASLFVQSCGRGLRVFPDKKDCLVLDMTDNFARFGTLANPLIVEAKRIENEIVDKLGEGEGLNPNAPKKDCPSCGTVVYASTKVCPYCTHIFITHSDKPKTKEKNAGWFEVLSYNWFYSTTKKGEPCVIVDFRLKDRKKNLRQWLMYKNQWPRVKDDALRKLSVLKNFRITEVFVQDFTQDFPKVVLLKHETTSPIPAIAANEGGLFR